MSLYTGVIYQVAITSRLTFLGLSLIANVIIPDHKSDGFVAPELENVDNENFRDRLVWFLFGGLMRWDAQHFLQIAKSGYSYHTSFAFFPLFPLAVRIVSVFLQFILGLNILSSLLLASVILNSVLFVESTILLYKLSLAVLKHELFAYHSAIFFCLSPATVFFIAPYSESLFAYCTFKGMLNYANNKIVRSMLWFTLSTFVRSNGVINAGYPLHFQWFCIFKICEFSNTYREMFTRILQSVFRAVISCGLVILPFFLFQCYSYYLLCMRHDVNHSNAMMRFSESQGIPLVGMPAAITCNGSVTLPYFELQKTYWDVGFLRYYKWKQIPNFLLAAPVITLVLYYGLHHLAKYKTLIFNARKLDNASGPEQQSIVLSHRALVYMVQAVYLTITCALCINVQVTTRLIASSSPIIYWIASTKFVTKSDSYVPFRSSSFRSTDNIKPSGVIISTYFMSYAILGTILFSNNVPWT